ncbi:MAG: hypothetical protein ISQ53_02285 [Synechococcus sp. BS307-5m-G39]|nr:hypothetical protein [Synechococcus sp. BS307-5m-G39]MBL6801333.1 hypothetical protein [Synechococcus sp. BS307-5m-G37]
MNQSQCHRIQSVQVLVDSKDREATWDAVEDYFNCISHCDLNDRDCTISCTRQLRDAS